MIWLVCLASSREGARISASGPSPPLSGSLASSCSASMMAGSENARVLPEPVNAIPIRSRPERMTGRPCIWMGVGREMPLEARTRRTGPGARVCSKSTTGAGRCSPSTTMRCLSRIACASSSVRHRQIAGGVQPVGTARENSIPLASSRADLSAALAVIALSISCSSRRSRSDADSCGAVARALAAATRRESFFLLPCCWGCSGAGAAAAVVVVVVAASGNGASCCCSSSPSASCPAAPPPSISTLALPSRSSLRAFSSSRRFLTGTYSS